MESADARTNCLAQVETLFGPEMIAKDSSMQVLNQPLAVLHEYYTGRFWNVPESEDSIFTKVMKSRSPPREVHEHISLEQFDAQYSRFRWWMKRRLLKFVVSVFE